MSIAAFGSSLGFVPFTPPNGEDLSKIEIPPLPRINPPFNFDPFSRIFDGLFGTPPAEAPTLPPQLRQRRYSPPSETPNSIKKGQGIGIIYLVGYDIFFKPINDWASQAPIIITGPVGSAGYTYREYDNGNLYFIGEKQLGPLNANGWGDIRITSITRMDGEPDRDGNPSGRGNGVTPPPAFGFGSSTAPPPGRSGTRKPSLSLGSPSGGTRPGTKPGTIPGTKPGSKPGNEPGTKPGSEPGTKPGPGTKPAIPPLAPPTLPPVRPPEAPPQEKPKINPTPKPETKPKTNEPVIIPPIIIPQTPTKPIERPEAPKPNKDPKEKPKVVPEPPSRRQETQQEKNERLKREQQERIRQDQETTQERIEREREKREEEQKTEDLEQQRQGFPKRLPPLIFRENKDFTNDQSTNRNNKGNSDTQVITPPPRFGSPPPPPPPRRIGTPTNPDNGSGDDIQQIKQKLTDIERKIGSTTQNTTNNSTTNVTNNNVTNVTNEGMSCQELKDCLAGNTETANIKKFKSCNIKTNKPEFETVQITVNKGDKAHVEAMAEALANLEGEQCKKTEEVFALVPEWWQVRTGQRPQLVVAWKDRKSDGTIGRSKWAFTIPHYNRPQQFKPKFPDYKKGDIQGLLVLGDNSKVLVNCYSIPEAKRLIFAIKQYIDPNYLKGSYEKYSETKGRFAEIQVTAVSANFFEGGQASNNPTWSISLV